MKCCLQERQHTRLRVRCCRWVVIRAGGPIREIEGVPDPGVGDELRAFAGALQDVLRGAAQRQCGHGVRLAMNRSTGARIWAATVAIE